MQHKLIIPDLKKAIRFYYEKIVLNNDDIRELFNNNLSNYMFNKRKREAILQMKEKKISQWSSDTVNTECAFEAWGLNITDLEKRYAKLQKLGLLPTKENSNEA